MKFCVETSARSICKLDQKKTEDYITFDYKS